MKNIIQFNNNVTCGNCNIRGFFTTTPNGGDYTTCPLCGEADWDYKFYGKDTHREYIEKYGYIEKGMVMLGHTSFNFCGNCNVMFNSGCMHASNGCDSSVYNGHLVRKWKYDNNIYVGMPCFDNDAEFFSKVKDIEVLEELCPNNGSVCHKGCYSVREYPEHYPKCNYTTSS